VFLDELNRIEAAIQNRRKAPNRRLAEMRESRMNNGDDEIVPRRASGTLCTSLRIDPDYFESRTHAPIHVGGHE
jgi:hypothetical protein